MLNLLTASQTREADRHTIANLPIDSIDLMERASMAFTEVFIRNYPNTQQRIGVYCGTGNNGGDGLAIARLLFQHGYSVDVKIARFSGKSTKDFDVNLARLLALGIKADEFRSISEIGSEGADVIIDALLGSGFKGNLEGEWLELVKFLNGLQRPIVSVDVPTGFNAEGPFSSADVTIKSDLTISFQRPKISFFLPESTAGIKAFEVVDIGLDEAFIQSQSTPYLLLTDGDIASSLKKRQTFSHKGTFGHALIIAGAAETMGAALLCTEACLNSGAGLTSACIPPEGLAALNTRIPEAMAVIRYKSQLPADLNWDKYNAIGIGPGLGTGEESRRVLLETLRNYRKPLVIDADAINLLASSLDFWNNVPRRSVLTPHVKEFDRLFGVHANWWERLEKGIEKAQELNILIVLKNRYTMIFTPEGKCIFNPTGTPAMATGGAGDVLTGIITSFLAQGYESETAAMMGVFIHGKAGTDIETEYHSYVVTPSILISRLPQTIGRFAQKV